MSPMSTGPLIIQGGMGIAVSDYRLARAVSSLGPQSLGVVSGTALDAVMTRRLQDGDPGGDVRRALARFPFPDVAREIIDEYFIEGGKADSEPYRGKPMVGHVLSRKAQRLLVASNFVEVFLAREGHDNPVGINYLTKIQTTILPSLYGATLAGASYVIMGAGIPKAIPGFLDRLSRGEAVRQVLDVTGADKAQPFEQIFDPRAFAADAGAIEAVTAVDGVPVGPRPAFLAIVSSASLANMLARKADGHVDGFVIEGFTAGGHNAPPRGKMQLSERGEPIYGPRDQPDFAAISALGRPFWLAGGFATSAQIHAALDAGASGVQVGTAFAFCEESGIVPELKAQVLDCVRSGRPMVFTDPRSSPTGFPFKGVTLEGTLGDDHTLRDRTRRCDQGYLREGFAKPDGTLGWRCSAQPVDVYEKRGGDPADTEGRICLCNGLLAGIGLGQVQESTVEPPILTAGDSVADIAGFVPEGATGYTAADVVRALVDGLARTEDVEATST